MTFAGVKTSWRFDATCEMAGHGLLLGEAMQCSQAEDQVDAVNTHDLAVREEGGQGIEGDAVVGVIEGGDEDDMVCDVEIGVASRQTLVVEDDGLRHGQGDDCAGAYRPDPWPTRAAGGSPGAARGWRHPRLVP